MTKNHSKKLKNIRQRIKDSRLSNAEIKSFFSKSKVDLRSISDYQKRVIYKKIRQKLTPEKTTFIFKSDRPDIFFNAGFEVDGHRIFTKSKTIEPIKSYKSKSNMAFYDAKIFGGIAHIVLIPTVTLPDFLKKQIILDKDFGGWYDRIALREGDVGMWGQGEGFSKMRENAEELYMYLIKYLRGGDLSGHGQTYTYIQVCYIKFD